MSFKAEVVVDSSGRWTTNALRFASREEAEAYGADLAMRWILVREVRVVESVDPANYRWDHASGNYYRIDERNPHAPV
jgi:hypothetical protein